MELKPLTNQYQKVKSDQKRVLLVDDSHFQKTAISLLLKKEGFNVDTASNGLQALSMIENNKYQLVITDHTMDLMTGLEMGLLIRHQLSEKELPILVLSGEISKELLEEYQKVKVSGFFIKQKDLNPLLNKIKELLGV